MPDITMCEGADCPKKNSCYRYTAKASEYRQSFFINSPIKNGKCEHFLDNSN